MQEMRSTIGILAIALGLSGCSPSSTFHIPMPLGESGDTILTSAELRGMNVTAIGEGSTHGRVSPKQITCVEPSADLAKAISSNRSLGASAPLGGLFGVPGGETALSSSKSVSESAAQMTERLAAIQLLRDALYRACEAYANGALSRTSYAVLLSRYDDVMITMLLAELAAGRQGGTGASLGGQASGNANATILARRAHADESRKEEAESEKVEVDGRVAQQIEVVENATSSLQKAKTDLASDPENEQLKQNADARQTELTDAKVELARLEAMQTVLDRTIATLSSTAATSRVEASGTGASGGSGVADGQKVSVAESLEEMQRRYLQNINSDAMVVACISALDEPKGGESTRLADFCDRQLRAGGLLSNNLRKQGELLEVLVSRGLHNTDIQRVGAHVDQMVKIRDHIKKLRPQTAEPE